VLIMDEPTAALTEPTFGGCSTSCGCFEARGVGIVYISHRMDEIFEIADRVTVLRDGAYVGTRASSATTSGELVEMMVGRRIEALFPKIEVADRRPGAGSPRIWCAKPMTRGVSLTVCAGEIVGLGGLVGSGRSELAQTMFRNNPAESGEIISNGRPSSIIRSPGRGARARHRLRAGGSRHAGARAADECIAQFLARLAASPDSSGLHRPRR
jgi:rhamnose transport system ATP-binding protein